MDDDGEKVRPFVDQMREAAAWVVTRIPSSLVEQAADLIEHLLDAVASAALVERELRHELGNAEHRLTLLAEERDRRDVLIGELADERSNPAPEGSDPENFVEAEWVGAEMVVSGEVFAMCAAELEQFRAGMAEATADRDRVASECAARIARIGALVDHYRRFAITVEHTRHDRWQQSEVRDLIQSHAATLELMCREVRGAPWSRRGTGQPAGMS